ncbi:MAG: dipeptidase [Agathobaculum sp.]|jgi:membrane dipeptidase|uniref:dipeptidase n=1 Tax=Agathobaculum sp. TaxID=2048138 RepID=UPI003D93FE61
MNLFDLHCDTLYECYETGKPLRENDLHINRAAARRYGHYAQFFSLFCGARPPEGAAAAGRRCLLDLPEEQRLDALLETAVREFSANADWLAFCRTADDLTQAAAAGKAAAFLSIEGAELLATDEHVVRAYEAGVRMVAMSWNYRSRYACGAMVDNDEGLTAAGKALVRTCTGLGMLIDVSHLSERGFWDVCEQTDVPFAASHSNSRVMCKHLRNLTDRQCGEIVRRGGLVGLNLYTPFLVRQSDSVIDDAIDHIEHFLSLYGAEKSLALGCDFDGCDLLPAGIDGLADMYKLADRMLALGYKESMVNGLFYDNAFAFVQKML